MRLRSGLGAILAAAILASGQSSRADNPAPLTDQQKTLHVLNRLGFGPAPGDIERVQQMGLDRYIQLQLHPDLIDDSACDQAIARLDTLKMDASRLMESYFSDIRGFLQQQMMAGNMQEMKLRYGIDPKMKVGPADAKPAPKAPDLSEHDAIRCVSQLQQAKLMRAVLSQRQLNEVLVDFWSNHFNIDIRKDECRITKIADDRDAIRPHVLGRFRDLLEASARSPAMLKYLDNSDNSVPRERSLAERKIIEWFITAKLGLNANGLIGDKEGPNENYGREILELHTLGVDGGYTQKDVQEVARCFTGWAIGLGQKFEFQANRHDNGRKVVLGRVIPAGGGISDGEMVLDILASHPSTARHISFKLCQRFVSDDPPKELVERAAKVFRDTDGDLRRVVETIVTSPEFLSAASYRAKIKSPFEYAASAVRALGAEFVPRQGKLGKIQETVESGAILGYGANNLSKSQRKSLNAYVFDMGQPLFAYAAPTGYPEVSKKWVSPGALIDRLNFAMALTDQEVTDVRVDLAAMIKGVDADQPRAVFQRLSDSILHGEMTASTRDTLQRRALPREGEAGTVDVKKLTALMLGSPEFQRR